MREVASASTLCQGIHTTTTAPCGSPWGRQDKLVLARLDGRWQASIGGSATTHILKPEPTEWPGLVEAEAWSLHLVGQVTAAATAEVAPSLGDRPTLVVTRFDRTHSGDHVTRLHQEDVCQVLGLLPSHKYSEHPGRDGDPSYRSISEILRANAVDVPEQLRTLLRQMVAHVVLMDTDAHGKNVSFLHDGQGYIRQSPVYDIVPTTAFLGRQRHLAMSVDGKYRVDQIERSDLFAEAVSWGYPRSQAQADVEAAISGLDAAIPEADAAFPAVDPRARLQVTGQLF
jgi:serine/threonine-protein kinase HipA